MPGQNQYETARLLTSQLTRSARIARFRQAWQARLEEPARDVLEGLLACASELDLHDDDIGAELADIRASLDALALRDALTQRNQPLAMNTGPLTRGGPCHFVCPVRFGRRRTDQSGQLLLNGRWLIFRGALDMSVSWSEVRSVRREGLDVIVALRDSRRVLRFCCHDLADAARSAVLASHLARMAAAPDQSPQETAHGVPVSSA